MTRTCPHCLHGHAYVSGEDAASPGMVVDGDVLADVIADTIPREITDEAARVFAGQVLDAAKAAGMTVLHGPEGRHR